MESIYKFLLEVNNTLPPWAIAGLAGWLVSWGVVQGVKFLFPVSWEPLLRKEAAQLMATGTAFITTLVIMPTYGGLLVALIAGLWSPISYAILMGVLFRYVPWLADILSGDVRGTLIGEKKENRP